MKKIKTYSLSKDSHVGRNTIELISVANLQRCEEAFHKLDDWSPNDYAVGLGGECGELLNWLKKIRRGQKVPKKELAKEIADIYLYLDLIAKRLDIDLSSAIIDKFNEVSKKKKSNIRLSK